MAIFQFAMLVITRGYPSCSTIKVQKSLTVMILSFQVRDVTKSDLHHALYDGTNQSLL